MAHAATFRATIHDGDTIADSASFGERVARVAAGLRKLGVTHGDCVSLLLRNDVSFLEATAAAQQLGAYAVPLNWHFKRDELLYVIQDAAPKALIAHSDLLATIEDALPPTLAIVVVEPSKALRAAFKGKTPAGHDHKHLRWAEWLGGQTPLQETSQHPPDSVIYTSGTTGHPKGVRRRPPTAEQAVAGERMRAAVFDIGPGDGVLVSAPLYHTAPNYFALRALRLAERLVLLPRFDAANFLEMIERHGITHVYAVPTMFVRLLALPAEIRARYDLSSLRFVLHAGGPCPPAVKQGMIDWLGPVINEYYGSTEHGPLTFCNSEEWLAHRGTVGRPAPGVTISIQDDAGAEVAAGMPGEIVARNFAHPDFIYHGREADRVELQRGELYATGDVGYLDADGFLYLCDRKRDLVVSGGVNIYPAEIEGVLAECPDVADSAVFGVPDPVFGESLVAILQPGAGQVLRPEGIRDFLKERLASYKVPATILFRDALPREESGKIKKRLLRDAYLDADATDAMSRSIIASSKTGPSR